jgi:hypothetical protein
MNRSFFFVVFTCCLMLVSCGRKIDQEQKNKVARFDSAWTETGAVASAWSGDLSMRIEEFGIESDSAQKMDFSSLNPDEQVLARATATACDSITRELRKIMSEYETFSKKWETDSKGWSQWKTRYDNGSVPTEKAEGELNDWRLRLSEARERLNTWTARTSELRAACDEGPDKLRLIRDRSPSPGKKL